MDSNLLKTKSIEQLIGNAESGGKSLRRTLSALDLTLLGIGAIIGTGIFVLTGTAAANQAGPAIGVSYLVAGLGCAFAALCYAEFASMIPIAGSAYTYAYATLGEVFAWMIGWDLILEYAVGSMTVAIGWSGYMQKLLHGFGIELPLWMSAAPGSAPGTVINLPAVLIVLLIMILLVVGVRESARANAVMVTIKGVVVLFFIAAGVKYVDPGNWTPYQPYGWSGIMAAAAVVFFAYIGFDAVSTTAEEAKNPAARSADRDHRVAGYLHGAVSGGVGGPDGDRSRHALPVLGGGAAGHADRRTDRSHEVPECAGGLRTQPDRPGLGGVPRVCWRGRRHYERAAGDADESAAHLLRHEPRPPAAGRSESRASAFWHALYHDDHYLLGRGGDRRPDADPGRRRDDQHRHAVRLRRGVRGGPRPARQASGGRAAVPRAVRTRVPGAGHHLLSLSDVEPAGADVGAVPGVAEHRDGHLLVLRPRAQSAVRPGGIQPTDDARIGWQLRDRARRTRTLQRPGDDTARPDDRARYHHRDDHQVARDRCDRAAVRCRRDWRADRRRRAVSRRPGTGAGRQDSNQATGAR